MFLQWQRMIFISWNWRLKCCDWSVLRRETILKVGGFSPSFPHYGEDYNYISRVAFHGMKVGIVPSLMVVHDRENRLISPAKIMYKHYTTNLRYISSPDRDKYIWLKIIYREAKEVLHYRSIDPIVYIYKLLSKYKSIELNREKSMTKAAAFLKVWIVYYEKKNNI